MWAERRWSPSRNQTEEGIAMLVTVKQQAEDNLKAKRLALASLSLHRQKRGPAMAKRGRIGLIALKLESSDGLSLRAFRAIDNGELHHLTLFQCLVAVRLDGRVMNKNIRVARLLNEPIALGVAEPLDLALCYYHGCFSSKSNSSFSAWRSEAMPNPCDRDAAVAETAHARMNGCQDERRQVRPQTYSESVIPWFPEWQYLPLDPHCSGC
jgi:hypothetical protein